MPDPNYHHNGHSEKIIPLYEERLVVERSRRKAGEIIIRKKVETELVEIPVYREKLIVERLDADLIPLAEIEIGATQLTGDTQAVRSRVTVEFTDLDLAIEALQALAQQGLSDHEKVRLQLTLKDESQRSRYQSFLERWSTF
ncbi:MAG: DUF2382 domain-containing protein [Snowella sp.]|nr:DUF2382 domain-containing protein [Snowella sp.]